MAVKDKAYWKEYNKRRKEYLIQKQRERRSNERTAIKESCIQLVNTTNRVVDKDDYNHTKLNTTDYNSNSVATSDYNQKPVITTQTRSLQQSDEKIKVLESKNQKLQNSYDYCQRRHAISKNAEFTQMFFDKRHKKFILYGCPSSCWQGRYCNNCSSFKLVKKED